MEHVSIQEVIQQIEDVMVPTLKLDAYETSLYFYLFRHTRLVDHPETTISIATIQARLDLSNNVVKSRLRSLSQKGCISIVDTGWVGTRVKVFLPHEIDACVATAMPQQPIDIEAIDFYNDMAYRQAILSRERSSCFYCLKKLTQENYSLDHVAPQIGAMDNSYRNIVAACHSCNSSKNAMSAEDFIRRLYREGRLNDDELDDRLRAVAVLKAGGLLPEL
jgi:predicted DNA-binding transcriptional regulator